MGSERIELDALRTYMADLLRTKGVEAMEAWSREGRTRLTGVVAAVSIRSCRAEPGAFWEYLGEELDPDTGTWRERYGRRLEVVFGLDLYAPGEGGAGACQEGFDALAGALSTGDAGGLRVRSLSRGVEVLCQAYLYAAAQESGSFTDFVVKGEIL